MKRRALLALFCSPVAGPVTSLAHSYKHGSIAIGHAWALPSQQADAQVFFPLVNNAGTDDKLLAARGDIASTIEFRRNNRYDDPAEKTFALKVNAPFAMRPTAKHLRLMGLRKPLVLGDTCILVLDFEIAGEAEIEVFVEEKPGQ